MSALQNHEKETILEIQQLGDKIQYYSRALQSLDDSSWIEKQMIEKLGVVPEGYKAIYFDEPSHD